MTSDPGRPCVRWVTGFRRCGHHAGRHSDRVIRRRWSSAYPSPGAPPYPCSCTRRESPPRQACCGSRSRSRCRRTSTRGSSTPCASCAPRSSSAATRTPGKRGLPCVQVGEMAEVVGEERAARAARLPARVEHEVVDDELLASLEQIEQPSQAAPALERKVLVDPHHREPTTLGIQRVPLTGELLLLREQRLPRIQPLSP